MREIADQEKVSERYVAQLLPRALLKPTLVEAALEGSGSLTISGGEIAKGITVSMEWSEQGRQ